MTINRLQRTVNMQLYFYITEILTSQFSGGTSVNSLGKGLGWKKKTLGILVQVYIYCSSGPRFSRSGHELLLVQFKRLISMK